MLTAGAHRGARLMQPAFEEFNRASTRFTLVPVYADPVPERASELARMASERGLATRGIEARVEDVLAERTLTRQPLVVSVDAPETIASVLETADLRERPILVYLLVRLPSEELMGVRAVLGDGDEDAQRSGAHLFRRLAEVTARSGAATVLGERGRPEHRAIEPRYRRWFADHMKANLTKVIARTRPENDPFEISLNGEQTMALMVRDSERGWADPATLAREAIELPTTPVVPGRDFAVAEIGTGGLRVHIARVRALDGKPAIRAAAVVDPEAYRAADEERRARAVREAASALERANRQMLSRTRPVFTTD